jgi:hypothetical protein
MWICPTCGEAHDDRFKECWQCAGAQMEQATAPKAPTQERMLRSFGSILSRAAMAFVVGALLGVALASRTAVSEPAEMAAAGLFVGLAFAGVVGLFVWVCFPYAPTAGRKGATSDRDEESAPTTPID